MEKELELGLELEKGGWRGKGRREMAEPRCRQARNQRGLEGREANSGRIQSERTSVCEHRMSRAVVIADQENAKTESGRDRSGACRVGSGVIHPPRIFVARSLSASLVSFFVFDVCITAHTREFTFTFSR